MTILEPPAPASWDRRGLEAAGFEGFVTFGELAAAKVPSEAGIYVVMRTSTAAPELLDSTHARVGSAYPVADLTARWVPDVAVIYIGKADAKVGGLRKRLGQYARRGSSHRGGRSIWQLADHAELLVAWSATAGVPAGDVETRYCESFQKAYGRLPFANRRR